jgi:hypothetical protein
MWINYKHILTWNVHNIINVHNQRFIICTFINLYGFIPMVIWINAILCIWVTWWNFKHAMIWNSGILLIHGLDGRCFISKASCN